MSLKSLSDMVTIECSQLFLGISLSPQSMTVPVTLYHNSEVPLSLCFKFRESVFSFRSGSHSKLFKEALAADCPKQQKFHQEPVFL